MAWRSGSLSRSLISTIRSSSIRLSTVPRLSPSPSLQAPRLEPRCPSLLSIPRTAMGALGCTQSLMTLHSTVAAARLTSHIASEALAFCELSQGT